MADVSAESPSDALGARLMLLARRAPGLVAILAMAVAGLGISIYLTVIHYQGVPPGLCPTTGVIDCAAVTSSIYSVLPGPGNIPITIPGIIWFLASGGMALVALMAIWRNRREPSRLRLAHLLWGVLGMVFVLYLVYAEIVVLHKLCEWCTVIHLFTLITFLIAFNRWLQRDLPLPALTPVTARQKERDRAPVAENGSNGSKARATATTATTATTRPAQSAGNGARRSGGSGGKSGRRARR